MIRIDPEKKKLLLGFMDFLENRGSKQGWVIVNKPSYETTNIRKSQGKTRPPKSMRQTFKIFAEWLEMGDDDLNYEIDRYIKSLEE